MTSYIKKKKKSSDTESYASAHSSLTIVPSNGSINSTQTITPESEKNDTNASTARVIISGSHNKKPFVAVKETKPLIKCSPMAINNCSSLSNGKSFQSDHNMVAVYLPGLFDGKKSAYIITYNEKGNPGYYEGYEKNGFDTLLPNLVNVDIVFIGIQEGDMYTKFVTELLNYIISSELPYDKLDDPTQCLFQRAN